MWRLWVGGGAAGRKCSAIPAGCRGFCRRLVDASLVVFVAFISRGSWGADGGRRFWRPSPASSLLPLGGNWLFQTVTFHEPWWIAGIYLFANLLRSGDTRLWLAVGGVLGLASKPTARSSH
jgi:hypothetical protein